MPPKKAVKNSPKLNLLYRISQVVGSDLGMSDILNVIVSTAADLMQSKIVTILLYDEDSGTLNVAAVRSTQAAPPDVASIPVDKSVSGKAVKTGTPQLITDISTLSPAIRGFAKQQGIKTVLCMPMMLGGRAIGVINSYSQKSGGFARNEMKLLSLVASQAAIAVENARMCALKAAFRQLKAAS
ncbi:MAG TPA: GAF domain-containing protein [bacterium]|jgi:GAF domain-containing protein|nr:GAF domain-containing protein [bacterium]